MLMVYEDFEYIFVVLVVGVMGYLFKGIWCEELLDVIV